MNTNTSKRLTRAAALRELRALVATYLEGSDDAARAAELFEALEAPATVSETAPQAPTAAQESRERTLFGCTEAAIDKTLGGKETRDVAMYAMSCLSNAQELIQRKEYEGQVEWTVAHAHHANTIRQLINIAKYAIDKAVPR
jgi:hypothetical protein